MLLKHPLGGGDNFCTKIFNFEKKNLDMGVCTKSEKILFWFMQKF
jgi:hypothetical protein